MGRYRTGGQVGSSKQGHGQTVTWRGHRLKAFGAGAQMRQGRRISGSGEMRPDEQQEAED